MNTNLFQTLLTVLITLSGLATTILVNWGCKDMGNAIDCSAASAPVWIAPYLVGIATVLGLLKLVIAFFDGKLVKPTVVVNK